MIKIQENGRAFPKHRRESVGIDAGGDRESKRRTQKIKNTEGAKQKHKKQQIHRRTIPISKLPINRKEDVMLLLDIRREARAQSRAIAQSQCADFKISAG